jgi:nucleotide-binding universal stress UspA family protein
MVDGSMYSLAALQAALRYKTGKDLLHIVHVVEATDVLSENTQLIESAKRLTSYFYNIANEDKKRSGIHHTIVTAAADPRDAAVKYLDDKHVDVLFIGHRGMSPFQRMFMGSFSEHVVAHASCDVMVVRKSVPPHVPGKSIAAAAAAAAAAEATAYKHAHMHPHPSTHTHAQSQPQAQTQSQEQQSSDSKDHDARPAILTKGTSPPTASTTTSSAATTPTSSTTTATTTATMPEGAEPTAKVPFDAAEATEPVQAEHFHIKIGKKTRSSSDGTVTETHSTAPTESQPK